MGSNRKKIHDLLLRISFDKPITKTAAISAARDNLYGEFYSTIFVSERDGWGTARIRAILGMKNDHTREARDLLEAAKDMRAAFGNCGSPRQQAAADALDAAIAKAEGRAP